LKSRIDKLPITGDIAQKALESMRVRWDIYWQAGGFTTAQQYQYLKDEHIDTALKQIFKEKLT
jgi:hypothetical protein